MAFGKKERRIGILIDGQNVRVVDVSSQGGKLLVHGTVSLTAKDSDDSTLGKIIESAVSELGGKGRHACLAVADRSIGYELVSVPKMKAPDRKKVLDRNAVRIAQATMESANEIQFASRFARETTKNQKQQDDYMVVSTAQGTIDRYIRLCDRAGIRLESMVPLAESLHYALRQDLVFSNPKQAYMLVELGSSLTHVVLLIDGTWVYSRDLNKGLEDDQALSEDELRLHQPKETKSESADAKSKFSLSPEKDDKPLPAATDPVPALLLGEIRRTILFLEREFGVNISQVQFTGLIRPGQDVLAELTSKIDRTTEWPVNAKVALENECNLYPTPFPASYAAAIGAVFAADDRLSMNLVPKALRPQKGVSIKRTAGIAASLAAAVAMAGVSFIKQSSLASLESKLSQSEKFVNLARIEQEQKNQSGISSTKYGVYQKHATSLREIRKNQSPAYFFMEELATVVPENVKILDIKVFRHGERWVYRLRGGVKSLRTTGAVTTFQDFTKGLRNSPIVDSVQGDRSLIEEGKDEGWGAGFPFEVFGYLRGIS